ncbi:gdsl family lipase : Nodulin-26 OS=Planctomyces maris DSM 8797 GN=PM8797T_24326 PE=4 SV=1: Lipase_GDSL_2 [Gemmataceae bacterium]|nr:gdsl family lipase : Nodulin-26 OS=Planctomyces maris DSM 8797 GN=PM8797T_24326 PE=4 SV=1: Lipase_GDSL_2 [Gemmataceae bacterium]VTT97437.1 gdsl family lipase : Nodulin-26 OS=Planctomyces maris DSM 8797 GN=PM8797T_24326 PE=4 SV=1: Lipase_GDSL_2 [Gemmataceae bacterium]
MFLSSALVALSLAAPPLRAEFEFKDGDRIVWLGGTLVEREQRYGYWETALLAANPGRKLTVRNLGWSGDTVHGESRGRFDYNNPDKCFKQLVEPALELKPTVIFISYGTNESFEGKEGLPRFEKGLEKLLDALKPANARIVLFPPMQFEGAAAARSADLKLYGDAVRAIAEKRQATFADPGVALPPTGVPKRLTDNGIHLTDEGYRLTPDTVLAALGLSVGRGTLDWTKLDPVRQAVLAKNEQFFNKWRPQNETYLFGFRKHEQGKNAKEIAEFDPFIAKLEDEIAAQLKALNK